MEKKYYTAAEALKRLEERGQRICYTWLVLMCQKGKVPHIKNTTGPDRGYQIAAEWVETYKKDPNRLLPSNPALQEAVKKNTDKKSFPRWLRTCRLRLGLTQEAAGAMLGMAPATLSKYERDYLSPKEARKEAMKEFYASRLGPQVLTELEE